MKAQSEFIDKSQQKLMLHRLLLGAICVLKKSHSLLSLNINVFARAV